MNKSTLSIAALMIMSINSFSEESVAVEKTDETGVIATTQPQVSTQSVRSIIGTYDTALHAKWQLRAGYITFKEDGTQRTSAYAIGGHVHFDTDRWNGIMLALSAYTILDLGINQNPLHQNVDFFDDKGKSFATLSKAFIDGKWGNTQIRLGRQALNTPLADADDIRMMPNYFTAYTITNTDIEHLTLTTGFIDKMAGWENGADASSFVDISRVLGIDGEMDGVYYAGMIYEALDNMSLSLWYYNYEDVADVLYAEAGYTQALSNSVTATLGLQYAHGKESGKALMGEKDASTFGANIEIAFENNGLTLMVAYNKDNGQTGAIDLSLGGGPFFTSMEDQTVDAIAGEGTAWMGGFGIDMTHYGIGGMTFGTAYGMFRSDTPAAHYHAAETDVVAEYTPNDQITLTAAYALVDHKDDGLADYDQFRLIGSYSF